MGFIDYLRNTIAPVGSRIAGGIQTIASKLSKGGNSIVDFIEQNKDLAKLAAPLLEPAKGVLSVVDGVGGIAGQVKNLLSGARGQMGGRKSGLLAPR